MRKAKAGFTIIEVSMFIALSGLILAGVIAGTQNSVNQQRYNDTVQTFTDFLKDIYSGVNDVEIDGKSHGRSTFAVYGKITFFGGYVVNQNGKVVKSDDEKVINSYNIIGDADGAIGNSNIIDTLVDLNVTYACKLNANKNGCSSDADTYNSPTTYSLSWDGRAESTYSDQIYRGAILTVKSPTSGITYTFYTRQTSASTADINDLLNMSLVDMLNSGKFVQEDINFCVAMDGVSLYNGTRRNVRIKSDAHDTSAIEIVALDDRTENKCEVK